LKPVPVLCTIYFLCTSGTKLTTFIKLFHR
jgi:hypothetical protein